MFFKFFQPKKLEPTDTNNESVDSDILASITYLVHKESPSVTIDISLKDYDVESAKALCAILNMLSEDFTYSETVNMLQSALIKDKQENLLIKIFTTMSSNARNKLISLKQESKKDEPCIKPSDML